MNLPNKLTVLRVLMIPLFLVCMFAQNWLPGNFIWALVLFCTASFTDYLDGYIARRDHLVTDFGKLMDPLADKLLVFAALICFLDMSMISSIAVYIILAREILVISVRLVAVENGIVIAADIWGKLKTVFQMIWVIALLVMLSLGNAAPLVRQVLFQLGDVLEWVVVALTVYSGFNYIWKSRGLFSDLK